MDLDDEGANRIPFLLADEEDDGIGAVPLASVALSRLTIIPSIPPDAVSGDWTLGWMGGGRITTSLAAPTKVLRLHGSGSMSITLALTDVPLLASFFPVRGRRWGGGGVGGRNQGLSGMRMCSLSTDRHAHGELRCFLLILVRNDKEEFCLGCIGTDERCFCRSTACNIMSH
jgi:hypothetical protein